MPRRRSRIGTSVRVRSVTTGQGSTGRTGSASSRRNRWAMVVISKSGGTLETAAAYRVFRREAAEFYGSRSERVKQLFVPITGATGKLRDLVLRDCVRSLRG